MDMRFENCEHIFDISPLIQINPFEKHLLNSNIKFEQFSISAVLLYKHTMVKDLPLPLSRRFILSLGYTDNDAICRLNVFIIINIFELLL